MGLTPERDWRDIAAQQGARLLQLRLALQILRSWSGGEPHSAAVADVIHRWIDAGMEGPAPWPDDPAFSPWAARKGLSNVNGSVGHWMFALSTTGKPH